MAVDVDETGGDDLVRCVDLLTGLVRDPHRHDSAVVDADVGSNRLGSGAVDDETVADREVDHREALRSRVAPASTWPSAITTP